MSGLTAYISEAAAGKKKTPQKWLADTVSLLSKCDMATCREIYPSRCESVFAEKK
ncbi:MAG: hypothetical protein ACLRP4_01175 [Dialister invisus]